jgi:hypothetical protein
MALSIPNAGLSYVHKVSLISQDLTAILST